MVLSEPVYIEAMERILRKTDYIFFIKTARGIGDFVDPWYLEELMKKMITESESPYRKTLLLLQMGYGADYLELAGEIGEQDLDLMIGSGIWRRDGDSVGTNNYIVLSYQGLFLLTEINPWYETCTHKNTDVYIGGDSLRLAEHIAFRRGAEVLDLCSGTGIQGLLAAKSARRVVSVEMNEKTVPVTRFNIRLNRLDDVVELRQGNLYDVLLPDEKFDFIYANPPFIPVADGVIYPICGDGGNDGRMVLDRIIERMPEFLKPCDSGQTGGEAIIFCECLGTKDRVFFDDAVESLLRENDWRGYSVQGGRIGTELQIENFLKLIKLFNENLDADDYREKIRSIYKKLGATYLYNLVYKINAEPDGSGKLRRIVQYSPWTSEDHGEVFDNISTGENKKTFGLFRGKAQISSVSRETKDVLELLRSGLSVGEIADELFSQKRANNMSRAALESRVESICLKLEAVGAIKRKP